jgi:hypothetical protein
MKKLLQRIKKNRIESYLEKLKKLKNITGFYIEKNKIYLNMHSTSFVIYFYDSYTFLKIKESIITELVKKYKRFEMEWI